MFSFRKANIERYTNPMVVNSKTVRDVLNRQLYPIFQFSHPCYSPKLLRKLDALCLEFGEEINIRFYDHPKSSFNGEVLRNLPNVQNLTINCMNSAINLKDVYGLKNIKHLWFGVDDCEDPDFLAGLNLSGLKSLYVEQNKRRSFDLTPLSECRSLEFLGIEGHSKNIQVIGDLPQVNDLTLRSLSKKTSLSFLNNMPSLRRLEIILGGRNEISEFKHNGLEVLEIIRVRGLTDLGPLSRFAALKMLLVEDQAKLEHVSLGNSDLLDIKLLNCSHLKTVSGLETSEKLFQIRVFGTLLPLDELLESSWPASLKFLALYSKNEKWNKQAEKRVRERGLQMMDEDET